MYNLSLLETDLLLLHQVNLSRFRLFFSSYFLQKGARLAPSLPALLVPAPTDLTDDLVKGLFDIDGSLGGGLEEGDTQLVAKLLALILGDLALTVSKIALVSSNNNRELLNVLDTKDLFVELTNLGETVPGVDSKYKKETLTTNHVLFSHGSVLVLASGIKDIEVGNLAIDVSLLSVGVLNCGIVLLNKVLLNKLDGQGRLPDTTTTNHDNLVLSHF